MSATLRAPFPWFGGKSRVAHLVWEAFGDCANYVEPFAGSLAVLLGRPSDPRIETVNDLDCYIANFWRAVAAAPDEVSAHADWPVNEADLHARHLWLVNSAEFRERMKSDPDFFDVKRAGWWVWGISAWLGSGWCDVPANETGGATNQKDPQHQQPRRAPSRKLPSLSDGGMGIHRHGRSHGSPGGGRGVHRPEPSNSVRRQRWSRDSPNGALRREL